MTYSCHPNIILVFSHRHLMGVNVQASTIHTSLSPPTSSSSSSSLLSDNTELDPENQETLPSIKVVVVKGAEDVTIKIADRAGGVPRSEMDKIWTFAHSTLDNVQKDKVRNYIQWICVGYN